MSKSFSKLLNGDPITDDIFLTLADLCRVCDIVTEQVENYVAEGIIDPEGERLETWRFRGACIRRVRIANRLQRDLGVNTAGAALAIELMERIETLEKQTDVTNN